MKTLDVAELSRLPEELKSGETIELVDDGKVVATVSPVRELEIPEEPFRTGSSRNHLRSSRGASSNNSFTTGTAGTGEVSS